MNGPWITAGGWLLHCAAGGGIVLLLAWWLMRRTSQPARRQRLGEWGLMAGLLLAVLSAGPAWLAVTIPNHPLFAATTDQTIDIAARAAAPAGSPADPEKDPFSVLFGDDSDGPAFDDLEEEGAAPLSVQSDDGQVSKRTLLLAWLRNHAAVLFAGGYLVVAVYLLGRWGLGCIAMWKLLREARPAPARIARVFASITRGSRVRLLVSSRLRVPVSFGMLRPTVIVPAALCEPGAATELRWVFAHELTHLHRWDTWTCALFALGQVVFFYVPWFWWLRRQVRLCQEFVADAVAAEHAEGTVDYAQFLLSFARAPAAPAGTVAASGHSSDLHKRVTMLLDSSVPVEKRCPLLWSLATAGGLLALAVVVSGIGLRAEAGAETASSLPSAATDVEPAAVAQLDEPAKPEEPKKADNKAAADQPRPPAVDPKSAEQKKEELQKRLEKARGQLKLAPGQMAQPGKIEIPKLIDPVAPQIIKPPALAAPRATIQDSRLGVSLTKPTQAMVDQLGLAGGQGLVVGRLLPNSAAAKSGLKAHDILLELDGKQVPDNVPAFRKMLAEIKPNTPVDVVVMRKSKKETVKGLALTEARQAAAPGLRVPLPADPQIQPRARKLPGVMPQPGIMLPQIRGGIQGMNIQGGGALSITRNNDQFSATRREGNLTINVRGTVANGQSTLKSIRIQDGAEIHNFDDIDEVPEKYRDRILNILQMAGGGRNVAPDLAKLPKAIPEEAIPQIAGDKAGEAMIETKVTRNEDEFTAVQKDGALTITVTGALADGKARLKEIKIQEGTQTQTLASADSVPEKYRSKIKMMMEMAEKGQDSRIEIKPR